MSLTERHHRGHKSYRHGQLAEVVARLWLGLKGYRLVSSRETAHRGTGAGEIDLIVCRGDVLAFVEVKKRQSRIAALSAVTSHQQQRIARGAERFLQKHPEYADMTCRFDVVALVPWRLPTHIADAWRIW